MRGELMAAQMAQQPDVISGLLERRDEIFERAARVRPPDLSGIVLVARGSSDNAAIYGRYILQLATHRVVALEAPCLHTLYDVRSRCDGFLAIAPSQSGRTPEITTVLSRLKDEGARILAVTNDAARPLGETAEEVIELRAGIEQAVPATKTYTAQLAAFALIAEALGDVPRQPGAPPPTHSTASTGSSPSGAASCSVWHSRPPSSSRRQFHCWPRATPAPTSGTARSQ